MVLVTKRLRLIGADVAHLRAAAGDTARLEELLGAAAAEDWPPKLVDGSFPALAEQLEAAPERAQWMFFFIIEKRAGGRDRLVGGAGLGGKPGDREVELGYMIVDSAQRRGLATEAARALIDHALARGARSIVAHTFPELLPSLRVLEKLGFAPDGPGEEERTLRFRLARSALLRDQDS